MTSSYTRAEVMPRVQQRRGLRLTADEAAAIMAGRQPVRGRYLGPANPGGGRAYASDTVNPGFVNPALVTNPQLSINSSISSPSVAALNSGTGGVATTGITAGTTAAPTNFGSGVTPTGAASSLPAGAFAGSGVRILRGDSGVTNTNASGNRP